ncbi:MAG: YidC/Oxa1 family membrane protein insertase [Patescibacteria group bacterium]
MGFIWSVCLFQPLLNALVWIYNTLAHQNMGWAVIILTVCLRVVLLPLSIISGRDSDRQKKVEEEARRVAASFKNDPEAEKEEYRKMMKKNRVSPWAKSIVLLLQFLVFLLLYYVFVGGIFGEKLIQLLYPSVSFPGLINNNFYGHNVGEVHDVLWAGICGLYLFVMNLFQKITDKNWQKSEAVFLVLFPIFTFVLLWMLPMAKSLFILTTMVFSDILSLLRHLLVPAAKPAAETAKK